MIIDSIEIAHPKFNAVKREYKAMVRFDYSEGLAGAMGQVNLICRTAAEECEAPKVIKERLVAHAISQLKWMPEFQKGDDFLTVTANDDHVHSDFAML